MSGAGSGASSRWKGPSLVLRLGARFCRWLLAFAHVIPLGLAATALLAMRTEGIARLVAELPPALADLAVGAAGASVAFFLANSLRALYTTTSKLLGRAVGAAALALLLAVPLAGALLLGVEGIRTLLLAFAVALAVVATRRLEILAAAAFLASGSVALAMYLDKSIASAARSGEERIPEASMLRVAFLGGGLVLLPLVFKLGHKARRAGFLFQSAVAFLSNIVLLALALWVLVAA